MGPSWSTIWALMNYNKLARGVDGVGRKIEVMSVYAGVGRDFGVKFGGAEVIYSDEGDRQEEVPQVRREGGVNASENGDEVVFKCSNSTFSKV